MLTDPLSITISDRNGGSAISLPAVSRAPTQSKYRSADGSVEAVVSQTEGLRNRRAFRVNLYDTAADPFIPAQNRKISGSCYLVLDFPDTGYTNANMLALEKGVVALLAASTDAVMKAVIEGQT